MPPTIRQLSRPQIGLIKERIRRGGVKTSELLEDLLDHFCVAIEGEMAQGKSFQLAFDQVFDTLQDDELKVTEMKTQELLEDKKIFYPDLFQSFLLALMVLAIGWLVHMGVQAIAVGIEDLQLRERWFKQNYLLIGEIGIILSLGTPIGYTIWRKRQTQINVSIFSFRAVPVYVYGVILLMGFLSLFWLEPLIIFFPYFEENREAESALLANFDPLLVVLIIIGNTILMELLFRGIILRGLLMTMTPTRAIFWSSLFCALLIYYQFASIFFFSLLVGWIYWKTRSLFPSIFFIIALHLMIYVIFHFLGYSGEAYFRATWWDYVDHNLLIYLPLMIGALLLTIALLYYLNRKLDADSAG